MQLTTNFTDKVILITGASDGIGKATAIECAKNGATVIIHGKTDVGSVGFQMEEDHSCLTFGYPYSEAPVTYIRKLTLAPATMAFQRLE